MTLERKASLLVGAIALVGALCLSEASAATYNLNLNTVHVPTTPATQSSLNQSISGGIGGASFTDNITFSLNKNADVSIALSSSSEQDTGSLAQFTSGINLTSVKLYSVSSKGVDTLVATARVTSTSTTTSGTQQFNIPGYGLYNVPYSQTKSSDSVLSSEVLKAHTNYLLVVQGTNLANSASSLNGSLTALIAPVPEPEQWAMILVGAALVSYQIRRKQKGLSHSTLA